MLLNLTTTRSLRPSRVSPGHISSLGEVNTSGVDFKPNLNTDAQLLLEQYANVGHLQGDLTRILEVIRAEVGLTARRELRFEVSTGELSELKDRKEKLNNSLKKICEQEGLDFETTLRPLLEKLRSNAEQKIKVALRHSIEQAIENRSFAGKLLEFGSNCSRSYIKLKEFSEQLFAVIKTRISVGCSEYFVNGKSFGEANEIALCAAAERFSDIRQYYQVKYGDSFWGNDSEFSRSTDAALVLKSIPLSPLSDLVFGSATGLIDLVFKDELGGLVYSGLRTVAETLNLEEGKIPERKEFIRWWSHGVEAVEVLAIVS